MDIRFRYLHTKPKNTRELNTLERGWFYLKEDVLQHLTDLAKRDQNAQFFIYKEQFDDRARAWNLLEVIELQAKYLTDVNTPNGLALSA